MQKKTGSHLGIPFQYYESGNPENPVLVCFHGLAGSSIYTFSELAPFLEDRFRLVLIDSPGHGGTQAFEAEKDYQFSNLAAWFHGAILSLLSEPFFVMGHSWGADAALHFTRHFPDNVRGLILLDGGFTFPQNQPGMTKSVALAGWAEYMKNADYANWQDVAAEYRAYTSRWNAEIERGIRSIFRKSGDGGYRLIASEKSILSIIEAFYDEPFNEAYSYIQVPTLLVHAELPKELAPARRLGMDQMESAMNDVSIAAMDGAGHMLPWDAPGATAACIKEWMQQKAFLPAPSTS